MHVQPAVLRGAWTRLPAIRHRGERGKAPDRAHRCAAKPGTHRAVSHAPHQYMDASCCALMRAAGSAQAHRSRGDADGSGLPPGVLAVCREIYEEGGVRVRWRTPCTSTLCRERAAVLCLQSPSAGARTIGWFCRSAVPAAVSMQLVCSIYSAQRHDLRSDVSTLRRGARQAFWKGVVPSLVMVSNPRRALGRTLTLPLTLAACVQRSGAASVRPGADSALRALGPLACARCAGAAACDRR